MLIPLFLLLTLAPGRALTLQELKVTSREQQEKQDSSSLEINHDLRELRSRANGKGEKQSGLQSLDLTVEGKAIHIPDLPEDALMAKARLPEVQARASESMTYLDAELLRMYSEQKEEIAMARALPAELGAGIGSAAHRDLWSLLKDQSLKEGEAFLQKTFLEQMEIQAKRAETHQTMVETQTAMYSGTMGEHFFNPELVDRGRRTAARATLAWEGAEFLRGLRPAWVVLAPRLEGYIQECARLMAELEAHSQPAATRLLGRLLKLQLFERCRALIDFNVRIWGLAAAKVLSQKTFHDVTVSGIRLVNQFN